MSVKNFEYKKAQMTAKYYEDMAHIYDIEINNIMKWFCKKFPNRHLRWVSAMGSNFWVMELNNGYNICDWEITTLKYTEGCWDTYYVDAEPDRVAKVLKPLWDLFQSINDVTNVAGNEWIQTKEYNSNDYHFDPRKML